MEGRATEELKSMFEEVSRILLCVGQTDSFKCAERFYGLGSGSDPADEEDEPVEDIEVSIKKEVASLSDRRATPKLFSPVHLDLECVLLFKTQSPIDPVDFVDRICKEILLKPNIRRMRYANRLTPVTMIGKATEKGLVEVAKTVLGAHFQLSGEESEDTHGGEQKKPPPYSVSSFFILGAFWVADGPLRGTRPC